MYITETDLLNSLEASDIDDARRTAEMGGDPNKAVNEAITYAVNYVSQRIGHIYDTASEFAKVGTARSSTMVDIVCDIAIWKLFKPFITVTEDGKQYKNYAHALKNIDLIEKGSLTAGLSRSIGEEGITGTIEFGVSDNFAIQY